MDLNSDIFFALEDGEIILRDYKNHQEFAIGEGLFKRLLQWSAHRVEELEEVDHQLYQEKLLEDKKDNYLPRSQWQWDIYSYIFHHGTRDYEPDFDHETTKEEWLEGYFGVCDKLDPKETVIYPEKEGEVFALPEPDLSLLNQSNFSDVLKNRKTCRSFFGEPIALKTLSTLLFATFGKIHQADNETAKTWSEENSNAKNHGIRKSSPSGGSLHPTEAYVICNHVDELQSGLYYYSVKDHTLVKLRTGYFGDRLSTLLSDQYWAKELSIGIFLTARFDRSWWKYPISRAYRVVLLDIGHLSQTFLLTATALGLQTWLTGAFRDSEVENFLKVQGPKESAMFFVGAGPGSGSAYPEGWFETYAERHHSK